MTDFILGGSKITVDGDCSHEIKRCLLFGWKIMTHLDSLFKSRDITLPTMVCLVKAMVFPVVVHGCECWDIKKAEHWRIDAFDLWCWRRLLRVPWTARRPNLSWIFIGRTDVETETPILWPPDVKNWLVEKDPDAGKDWRREKGMTKDDVVRWHHWLNGYECDKLWELVMDREVWHAAVHGVAKIQIRLSDLPELNRQVIYIQYIVKGNCYIK